MKEFAMVLGGLVFVVGVFAVVRFLVYAVEHSPTARRGKYTCYGCMGSLSAERAGAGLDCPRCEAKAPPSSEDSAP